jgi:ABC-type transporter lipoprotein component MlaA
MAKLSTNEEFALHEFSVRYRAGLAQQQQESQTSKDTVHSAVREQYEQEQQAQHGQGQEQPSQSQSHQIEDPEAGR